MQNFEAGAALMASVVMSTALATSAATAALIAVATQYGISAVASGGKGGTEQIQSGDADSTTTRSQTVITSSLLFGGNLALSAGDNANTQTANIKTSNLSQEVKQSSTTSFAETHTDIKPDYGSIAKGSAVTGVIAGVATVGGEWLNKNVKQKPSLASGSYENSNVGVNTVKGPDGVLYTESSLGGPDMANPVNMDAYNRLGGYGSPYTNNPALKTLNTVPGFPSATGFHDWAMPNGAGLGYKASTILPYFAASYCAAAPGVCAGIVTDSSTSVDNNTTTKSVLIQN